MEYRIRYISIFILVFFAHNPKTCCQSRLNFLEGNLCIVSPVDEFSKNVQDPSFAIEFGYLRQFESQKPLFWGVSIYYTQLGNANATLTELLDFIPVDFGYSTTSNLFGFNGKMRFYPDLQLGKFELYTELNVGCKLMSTSTTKTLLTGNQSTQTYNESNKLSLTYGVSAGVNYHIQNNFYLNFRCNYLPGNSTSYYVLNDKNKIVYSSLDKFDLKNSTTDIIRWDLGVTFWPISNKD